MTDGGYFVPPEWARQLPHAAFLTYKWQWERWRFVRIFYVRCLFCEFTRGPFRSEEVARAVLHNALQRGRCHDDP